MAMKKILFPLLLTAALLLSGCREKSTTDVTLATSPNNTKKTTATSIDKNPDLLINQAQYQQLAEKTGATKAKLVGTKEYDVTLKDANWENVTITSDECKIIKIKDYKDKQNKEYEGYVLMHFTIETGDTAVNVAPEKGVLTTNTSGQTTGNLAMDEFGGKIPANKTVTGTAAYPLEKLADADDVTTIELKFTGKKANATSSEKETTHDYDFILSKNR